MECMNRDKRVIVTRDSVHIRPLEKKLLDESAPATVILDYASALVREKKYNEAISVYSLCSKLASVPMESIQELTDSLIDSYAGQAGLKTFHTDPWSCIYCATVLVDPVTLSCGHSCCKKCLLKDLTRICKKCGSKYDPIEEDPIDEAEYVKVSILVSELVNKFWSRELEAVKLRNEGNRLYTRGQVSASLAKYSEAMELAPDDHLVTSNRSNAYFKNKQYDQALEDANRSIALKPDWGKAYFRRGMVLTARENYEEALVSYFQCLILEENCSKALRNEIFKVISKLISSDQSETEEMQLKQEEEAKHYSQSDITGIPSEHESESEPEDSEEDQVEKSFRASLKMKQKRQLLVAKNKKLCSLLDKVEEGVRTILTMNWKQENRHIEPEAVDKDDFDCTLCFRLLWHPVTTSCGHTYCKSCIDRSLDHKRECPLCKAPLEALHRANLTTNEFVEETIRRMLPSDFSERQRQDEEEMTEMTGANNDGRITIPVFVCTMSFPNIPCPLHVFEPRYRLMIRRVMLAGTREFGMCTNDKDKPFSDYGTMLEIRDIQYFPDGRSVVDTMGGRRFKVVERGTKDGYATATVEFLSDIVPEGQELLDLQQLHDRTRALAVSWFDRTVDEVKAGILSHYGIMPPLEQDYWSSSSGPAWSWWILAILPLDTKAQLHILSQTLLKKRLEAISRILEFMRNHNSF